MVYFIVTLDIFCLTVCVIIIHCKESFHLESCDVAVTMTNEQVESRGNSVGPEAPVSDAQMI